MAGAAVTSVPHPPKSQRFISQVATKVTNVGLSRSRPDGSKNLITHSSRDTSPTSTV